MCIGICSINHGHGPKACKLAEREQGNEFGKNCDHAHDGMAVARSKKPPRRCTRCSGRERSAPSESAILLDQGITPALWGARHPDQLQPVDEVTGWGLDSPIKAEIDRILRETITDPVGPEFMAPPARSVAA
jgi:hypothetical protein